MTAGLAAATEISVDAAVAVTLNPNWMAFPSERKNKEQHEEEERLPHQDVLRHS